MYEWILAGAAVLAALTVLARQIRYLIRQLTLAIDELSVALASVVRLFDSVRKLRRNWRMGGRRSRR